MNLPTCDSCGSTVDLSLTELINLEQLGRREHDTYAVLCKSCQAEAFEDWVEQETRR